MSAILRFSENNLLIFLDREHNVKIMNSLLCFLLFSGVYDVISNLGSLLPRLIFLPLEDSSYLLFTQTLARKREENTEKDVGAPIFISVVISILYNLKNIILKLKHNKHYIAKFSLLIIIYMVYEKSMVKYSKLY